MKAFVISMDTPNGRKRLENVSVRCKEQGIDFEHIVGVDGKKLSPDSVPDVAYGLCTHICTPGTIGCVLSHMKCWKRVIDDDLPYALILEDDAVLKPNFVKNTMKALHAVPEDFHVLVLGCYLCSPLLQNVLTMGNAQEYGEFRDIRFFGGSHAYIISNAGARHLLEHHKEKAWYHVDYQMSFTPGIKIFAANEELASQEDMSTSALAGYGFPSVPNRLLAMVKGPANVDAGYYLNVAMMRVGTYRRHIILTPWHVIFLLFGVLGVPWKHLLVLSMIDVALFGLPGGALDLASKVALYATGYTIYTHLRH